MPAPAPPSEVCPLCHAPLHPEQEWCLHCGAAARTRLAASPRWKGLIAALAVVVALSLGVLAAALVKLAGGSGNAAPAITRTVTTAASASASALTPSTATGTTAASTPGVKTATTRATTTTPGTKTSTSGSSGTRATTVPSTAATTKLGTQVESGLTKKVRERLRKLGVGKLLPSAGTR